MTTVHESEAVKTEPTKPTRKGDFAMLVDLAIEIIHETNPRISDVKFIQLWKARIKEDELLLEACLREQGNRALMVARNFVGRKEQDERDVAVKKYSRRRKIDAALSRAALEVRNILFNLVAENGKKIRDLTGYDLDRLEGDSIARANFYRELHKYVRDDQVVGVVLVDDTYFKRVVANIGDMQELIGLFGQIDEKRKTAA